MRLRDICLNCVAYRKTREDQITCWPLKLLQSLLLLVLFESDTDPSSSYRGPFFANLASHCSVHCVMPKIVLNMMLQRGQLSRKADRIYVYRRQFEDY